MERPRFSIRAALRASCLTVAFVSISGFGSCSRSLEELCAKKLPEYDRKIVLALDTFDAPARALASSPQAYDSKAWQHWAEELLGDAQAYLDVAAEHPRLRPVHADLTRLANELVEFHGYATAGRRDRMKATLGKIRLASQSVIARACGNVPLQR